MDITGLFSGLVKDIFTQVGTFLSTMINGLVSLLPDSPFTIISNSPIASYLKYINWFLPFDFAVQLLQIWVVSVSSYYIYSVILRWIKAIE